VAWSRALWLVLALACLVFPASAAAAPNETIVSSRSSGPGPPDGLGPSFRPSASADGRFVAFISSASNLVPGDVNQRPDVFVRDHQLGTTILVSRASGPGPADANNRSDNPSISGDGRFVAFQSGATNLVPGDVNGKATSSCATSSRARPPS
jgi:Tol biopolymer transport system component